MQKIIAISGSTRSNSTNLKLIKAIRDLAADTMDVAIFNEIATLPHFNPDIDGAAPPAIIVEFRKALRAADAILICTPEYAMGVPGSLKNAIDWLVSSCECSQKPMALITASSIGQKGHASLMETLKVIEANIPDSTQLIIPFAKTKINDENKITDTETASQVVALMDALSKLIEDSKIEETED